MLAILQQAPADTVNYMVAGYTVIFGVIVLYLISLALRVRNYRRDGEMLEELDQKKDHK